MSRTIAFKVFLTAELLKLRNPDMAAAFLGGIQDEDRRFLVEHGLTVRPEDYGFVDVGAAGEFLGRHSEEGIRILARLMSGARGNYVYSYVMRHEHWDVVREIDMSRVSLSPAEAEVSTIFGRGCHKVLLVVTDPELWTVKPYSEWAPEQHVEYPICLATRFSRGRFKIFDGTHRALQLARNGKTTIDLCCPV
jgi:hypothetical protein